MSNPAIQLMMRDALNLHHAGALQDAAAGYHRVLEQMPDHADALHMLGLIAIATGQPAEAVNFIKASIRIQPNTAESHFNLAVALERIGELNGAQLAWLSAIRLQPTYAEAHYQLGRCYRAQGKLDPAIASLVRATSFDPHHLRTQLMLGEALRERGRLDESVAVLTRASETNPTSADAFTALAHTLSDQARLDEARTAYQRAMKLEPDNSAHQSSLLCGMYFHPAFGPEAILQEHRAWNTQHAKPLMHFVQPNRVEAREDHRPKIGYLSPDFRSHPVGRFLIPTVENHDRSQFELHAYSTGTMIDSMTDRLRAAVDHWHPCAPLSDQAIADQISADGIDILVELSLHSAYNRLLVLARKPAPVQVTWLGYAGTTGLDAIDYRLSDPFIDPPGDGDALYAEQTIRLPTYWCYPPPVEAPAVVSPPSLKRGFMTFGSLNNFMKVNSPLLTVWARILKRVENARLLLHCKPGAHWKRVLDEFKAQGADPARVGFVGTLSVADYFRQYQNIDIALDTTPYSGGTTTCDALYMGVPVVTLRGRTAVGRIGVSMLSHLQLPELIAETADQYVEIAASLAENSARVAELRSMLRPHMLGSTVMNAAGFTRGLESAYRSMLGSHS